VARLHILSGLHIVLMMSSSATFANLPRPREKLDSAWCGLLEAFQEVPTWNVVTYEFKHTRIIIKIYLMNVRQPLSRPSGEIAGWLVWGRSSVARVFRKIIVGRIG